MKTYACGDCCTVTVTGEELRRYGLDYAGLDYGNEATRRLIADLTADCRRRFGARVCGQLGVRVGPAGDGCRIRLYFFGGADGTRVFFTDRLDDLYELAARCGQRLGERLALYADGRGERYYLSVGRDVQRDDPPGAAAAAAAEYLRECRPGEWEEAGKNCRLLGGGALKKLLCL